MSARLAKRMQIRTTGSNYCAPSTTKPSVRASTAAVLGLMQVESGFRKYAVSGAGARGYMQVMPFWVRLLGPAERQPVPHAHESAL